jgi:hypothetical protein
LLTQVGAERQQQGGAAPRAHHRSVQLQNTTCTTELVGIFDLVHIRSCRE